MRRSLALLIPALVFGAASALLRDAPAEERLNDAAQHLEVQVARLQVKLGLEARAIADEVVRHDTAWSTSGSCFTPALRAQREDRGIEYSIFLNGRPVAWTGNAPASVADTLPAATVLRQANGCWLLKRVAAAPAIVVQALGAVWYEAPFENRYVKSRFHPSLHVPEGVEASMGAGLGPVVRDVEGRVLFRLQWSGDAAPPGPVRHGRLFLVLACAACMLLAWGMWLSAWAQGGRPWSAILIAVVSVAGLRWLSLSLGPWDVFTGLAWFQPDLYAASIVLPSFGDLLITVALLVFQCALMRHALRFAAPPSRPGTVAAIASIVLLGFAAWINELLITMMRDSSIPLDLFHAQSLDVTSAIALLAIAFLLFGWVMLADGIIRWLAPSSKPGNALLIVLIASAVAHVLYHLLEVYDSLLVLWPLPLLICLWYMRSGGSRLLNALLMVTVLSVFTVHVLNRQTFKRTERDRAALAGSVVAREDPVVEWLFREARTAITRDPESVALLNDSTPISAADLDARLRQRFFQGAWNNYDVRLHVFGIDGRVRGSTSLEKIPTLAELRARFEQGIPVAEDNMLRNVHRPVESALYIGAVELGARGRLVVELLPRVLPEGLGFPELLMAGDRAMERRSDRFSMGRYERGVLVESTGAPVLPTRWTRPIPEEGTVIPYGGYDLFASGDPGTSLVVVASAVPGWLDHVTTFSYLFILFAVLAAGFLVLRTGFLRRGLPSLGMGVKLRGGIVLVVCIAIGLFAFGAQRLLRTEVEARTRQQLDERSRSAIAELRQHVHLEGSIAPTMFADVDHWLDKASAVLLTDVTAYTPDGRLMATSREQVFNNGLLGTRMDPDAYLAMAVDHRSAFIHSERIGDAEFLAAYRPLLNDRGDVLAYLAVPYFARQSEVDDARAAGYVAIANLLVVLFLLSLGAATLIATWTAWPLSALKRGLERIQLGARNEPLSYRGDDELGELVRVYNRKVEELRESAEKLARSERESAWREMAKQVAHEIKNPLTPMKLGIQHFQRTWDPGAPDAKEKLDRFASSITEQIDALSRVAGDFSRFAQMSAANETVLDLNEVAQSAVALFAGEPHADVVIVPAPPLMVKADREHLLRVFNNLIKNALQAIPEERRGRVDVILQAENGQAIAEVRDNGTGIPEEVRPRIFTPNFTTKGSGTGLGLAMVKRMVEQAGGQVWFETVTGEGTTFKMVLPVHHQKG